MRNKWRGGARNRPSGDSSIIASSDQTALCTVHKTVHGCAHKVHFIAQKCKRLCTRLCKTVHNTVQGCAHKVLTALCTYSTRVQ